jgi:hypothetical protein
VILGTIVVLASFRSTTLADITRQTRNTPTPQALSTPDPAIKHNLSQVKTLPTASADFSPRAKQSDKAIYLIRTKSGAIMRVDVLPEENAKIVLAEGDSIYDVIPPRSLVGQNPEMPRSVESIEIPAAGDNPGRIQGTPPPGTPDTK